jgi:hypothetical protein
MSRSQKFVGSSDKSSNLGLVPVKAAVALLCLLAAASSGLAAITIEGVTDQEVYADRVTFTVRSEAGYTYTAELNGKAVAVDAAVEVNEPDYYELTVSRYKQSSGGEETQSVRFIVRDSKRGDSEWGLPPWIPYPMIDSAASEFAGAKLIIVTPAEYPMGLEIPVVARVENASGNRLGVNGKVVAAGFAKYPLRLLRGVGSVFLPAQADPNVLSYAAGIHSLTAPKEIVIEGATNWRTVSADITSSADWGENARVRIAGDADGALTVRAGATLTVGSGSIIVVDPDIEIAVEGRIVVNGAMERPVVFTSRDRTKPWGGFIFEKSTSRGEFTGTILTGSGADSDWFSNNPGHGHSHRGEQPLLFVSNGARLTLTDCWIVENHGQAGHGEGGYLTMTRCLVQRCITAGQYNGGAVTLNDCALIEFPSATAPFSDADNDALYLTGGAHSLTGCLVGWALDDCVDGGSGSNGSVTVNRCWFESTYHEALAWSEQGPRTATNSVALNCGQGIECGFGSPDVNTVHCFSTGNLVGARFGDNYDWSYNGFLKVTDSLLLFNKRDIWGRAWDNWTVHLSRMNIRDNWLTAPDADFPNNHIWNPQADPSQLAELEPFLPCPADTVGVGFAVPDSILDLSLLAKGIPVRLSTFTTATVSVDYTIDSTEAQNLASLPAGGTLHFVPGQTVQKIQYTIPAGIDLCDIRVTLSNPVNAELTGYRQITHKGMCGDVGRLVREGDKWRYFKGTQEPPATWNSLAFDDGTWLEGPTPIGYEASSGYEKCIATKLSDMRNAYISVYARRYFVVDDPSKLTGLYFAMDADDGYIAYVNGVQVSSRYVATGAKYNQSATTNHEACCGTSVPNGPCPPEQIDLSSFIGDLVPGVNVLAVQVHNVVVSSSDFIFIPELTGVLAR